MGNDSDSSKGFNFKAFATPRIIGGIVIIIIVLWALTIFFGTSDKPTSSRTANHQPTTAAGHEADSARGDHTPAAQSSDETAHGSTHAVTTAQATTNRDRQSGAATSQAAGGSHDTTHRMTPSESPSTAHDMHSSPAADHRTATDTHAATGQTAANDRHPLPASAVMAPVHKPTPKGVAFVKAAIRPMEYELEERWWKWRPNDLINVTDNVNNFQLGVLEITRRTVVALAERISRHGVTDALDPNLEEAMNWFMVKPSSYWFPSAESKYKDALDEMQAYLEKLKAGKATFYIRSDNLIPLLASFEDILGSCDENLVKDINEDGTPVSFFKADDYFYYTRGVASAMAMVLEAVHHDFLLTLESRNATELLHHAVVSCQRAAAMEPWIVLDRDLSSVFANHRANMAAPISHARFYLGQLIKTLST